MEEKTNILLVEDNPGDAQLLNIHLKASYPIGFSLTTASYVSEALELLAHHQFDVIILDLSLPDSSDLDTFKRIYNNSPDIPIIVLTGHEDGNTGINAVKLGAQDFLVKGAVSGTELARAIKYSIERFKLIHALAENTKSLEDKTFELQREKLKLSEAQKLSHIGSWEWDIEKDTVSWSDELYRIFGQTREQFNATFAGYMDCVHHEDKEYVKKKINESATGLHPFNFYHRIILNDKSIRTIHSLGKVVQDKHGKACKMIGTAQDVTERVNEEELKKLAHAATQSFNSVIITDRTGKIEWVNEGFTKLTGYQLEDVVNTFGEILRSKQNDPTKPNESFENILKDRKPLTYESKNITKQGKEYWVITTLTPVFSKNGELIRIIAIDSDITVRKQMEEELLMANRIAEHSLLKGNKALNELMKAKKELEESMRVKEQFLANMSHEIRTPMNAIVGFTDLILKTELTTEQKQYTDAIKTSGENLLVIINDILDFSKLQSGKIAFEAIEMRLTQLLPSLTELMLPKSIEKNIRLSFKIDPVIPEYMIGDPTRLNQVLLNLVGNAIKFTQQGEVKISVEMLNEKEEEFELKFSVADTGIGISPDKIDYVFQGFTQASNATTRKYGGTGLGLSIAKQLIELQGGQITATSEPGKGSVFSFILRFRKSQRSGKENSETQKQDHPETSNHPLNILLVEDNQLNQILAKKVLNDWNWNVEIADNGLIALEKLKTTDFDLILMDIQLPEMDGYETTKNIRETFSAPKSEVPIMAMTAHAMTGEAEKCTAAGMDEYISKPFDTKTLYQKITTLLAKK